jgi:hypothetical protein
MRLPPLGAITNGSSDAARPGGTLIPRPRFRDFCARLTFIENCFVDDGLYGNGQRSRCANSVHKSDRERLNGLNSTTGYLWVGLSKVHGASDATVALGDTWR